VRVALMAATGAGAEIATAPAVERVFEPDPALTPAFDAGHARYRAVQQALSAVSA